jgi:hypothetical protein
MARLLLAHPIDLEVTDDSGVNPLHHAIVGISLSRRFLIPGGR